MLVSNLSVITRIILVINLFLGLLFLSSGLGKILHLSHFIQGVIDYQVLPVNISRVFGAVLPLIELSLSALLLMGLAQPAVGLFASFLILLFVFAVQVNLKRGRTIRCNCYGIASTNTISKGTIARNIFLLALSGFVSILTFIDVPPDQRMSLLNITILVHPQIDALILIVLLLMFCIAAMQLIEWSVDIHYRMVQFRKELSQ